MPLLMILSAHTSKVSMFTDGWWLFHVQEESMVRYISPVNPAVYPHLAITLLSIGLFFMAWFFVYPHYSSVK